FRSNTERNFALGKSTDRTARVAPSAIVVRSHGDANRRYRYAALPRGVLRTNPKRRRVVGPRLGRGTGCRWSVRTLFSIGTPRLVRFRVASFGSLSLRLHARAIAGGSNKDGIRTLRRSLSIRPRACDRWGVCDSLESPGR